MARLKSKFQFNGPALPDPHHALPFGQILHPILRFSKLLFVKRNRKKGGRPMKKLLLWTALAALLMIGCPWLAVSFAGTAGMAVCFLLFFAVNPVFSAACGIFAGRNIKQLWGLPLIVSGLFLAGVWLFFEMGEPAFLIYGGFYLVIGVVTMTISAIIVRVKRG